MSDIAIVVSNDNKDIHPYKTIDAIKKAGFKNVFIQWYEPDKTFEVSQVECLKRIKEEGLNVVFAHLGYKGINEIWTESEKGESFVSRYINDLRTCKENGIDLVIMHLQSKWDPPAYSEIGLRRIKEILKEANRLKVKIAFENTRIADYVSYVMDNVDDEYAGVCIDVGHLHCNSKDKVDITKWKDKIYAVHLHDNDGCDDLHLIPFEGNIDWHKYLNDLKNANFNSYLTFEQCTLHYDNIDIYDFYQRSYNAANKIKEYYDNL